MANYSSDIRTGVIRCLMEVGAYNYWVADPVWASVSDLASFPDQFRKALNARRLRITSLIVAEDCVRVDVTAGPRNTAIVPTIVNGRPPTLL
jgi:hypothetical protein